MELKVRPPVLNKREKRRLAYLFTRFCYLPPEIRNSDNPANNTEEMQELLWLISRLKFPEETLKTYWTKLQKYRNALRNPYRAKPVRTKQDNKSERVGSGGSNRNTIRFPKKCRKTAWKRFYKLFPTLNPDNKKK